MTSGLRPALFLDRDGVINVEVDYLYRPEDCVLVDGIASLIRTANRLDYVTCVVTNQSGIGRGLYTEEDFHHLMAHIGAELKKEEARLDAVYFSPFHPVHGVGRYKLETDCRKPAPGMLLRAAADHGIDLEASFLVGDRCSDLEAGGAAGVQHLFLFGTTEESPCATTYGYRVADTLFSVEEELVATSGKQQGQ